MLVSENRLKWLMRFYPPLLLQRIWVVGFEPGFKGVHVRIKKSILNKNYNNSIFGASIFAAADPFYPVLFHQIFTAKGYKVLVWLKSTQIQYLKPARNSLKYSIYLTDEVINEIETEFKTVGKVTRTYPVEMFDDTGLHCVSMQCEVYIRDKTRSDPNKIKAQ